MSSWIRILLIYSLGIFYTVAGINHFVNPEFYLPLIPDYFPFPSAINLGSGILEVALGLGVLVSPKTRKMASWGIVILLIAFIPSHVYFIQIGSCVQEGLCVPEWVGWVRLVVVHPLLIFWAIWVSKTGS
ncbi:putative membrane protein [Algoriphagus boseongensis]|uniref:Putative membrane protein n=1 Tax=Algoriphagus boseongensis TaxID=1442587 RepID=A0A4R6T924_9BACT|nr:hypothetical protein [Algoriphagus boseongensis]TDQ19231.1 putative membrane protein [Algoriphagus boseongensis]